MAKNKTTENEASVEEFIRTAAGSEGREKDSFELLRIMQEVSGEQAKMWGASIIGFGRYRYKYASGHEGEAPLIGFSPRKTELSLHALSYNEDQSALLEGLGTFKMGKSCIYIKKLADIDSDKLRHLLRHSIDFLKRTYPER